MPDDVCKNCAYSVLRDEKIKFSWLDYECTLPKEWQISRIPYHYGKDTCPNFTPTGKPI